MQEQGQTCKCSQCDKVWVTGGLGWKGLAESHSGTSRDPIILSKCLRPTQVLELNKTPSDAQHVTRETFWKVSIQISKKEAQQLSQSWLYSLPQAHQFSFEQVVILQIRKECLHSMDTLPKEGSNCSFTDSNYHCDVPSYRTFYQCLLWRYATVERAGTFIDGDALDDRHIYIQNSGKVRS